MARLSTHVLDTSRGRPVPALAVDLHACANEERRHLTSGATDSDGRLLLAADLPAGVYELTFHAGGYFREAGAVLTDPPFLDDIVVRVGLPAGADKYHVPLLLSPYGYSAYRGS